MAQQSITTCVQLAANLLLLLLLLPPPLLLLLITSPQAVSPCRASLSIGVSGAASVYGTTATPSTLNR
jgi:hypothetical protein